MQKRKNRQNCLNFDQLEGRQLLAATPYTVLNLNATGAGSLAAAIDSANSQVGNPAGSIIQFAPGLSGKITTPVTLDLSETDGPEQIVGNGMLTISGGNAVGVFSVEPTTTASFSELTISDGVATNGGGVALGYNGAQGSNVTVTNCAIVNNTATGLGGGVFVDFAGQLTVVNSTIAGNTAGGGGGIMNKDGALVVNGSTIDNNTATGVNVSYAYGGGIYNNGMYGSTTIGTANISNSTITGNTALSGGGLYDNGGISTVTNCTITYNTATHSPGGYDGAGVYAYNEPSQPGASTIPSVIVNNTIIAGNTDSANIGGAADDLAGGFSTGSYNLVGTDAWGTLGSSNLVNVADPGLSTLASNGGPTQTIALLPNSPAIGVGSVALAVDANGSPLTIDQAGNPRVTNGHIDIGACEFITPQLGTAVINVTPYSTTYTGSVISATGAAVDSVTGASLSGLTIISTHTNVGTYTDTWTFSDPGYASASGSFIDTIAKANTSISVTGYNTFFNAVSHTASGTASVGGVLNLNGTVHTNVGTYHDSWTFTSSNSNYNNASGTVTDVITPSHSKMVREIVMVPVVKVVNVKEKVPVHKIIKVHGKPVEVTVFVTKIVKVKETVMVKKPKMVKVYYA